MPEATSSIRVDHDVPAAMRDGTVLRANVYRPLDGDRHPVLLTRLPYGKDLPLAGSIIDPVIAARRGYAVVIQDVRGRFASDGEFRPFSDDARDGHDTVAWAAGQEWSDGRVGMFGASYFGFTQWAAAMAGAPGLRAIAPSVTWCDPLNGHTFRGGAFELGIAAAWDLAVGMELVARRHRGDLATLIREFPALVETYDRLGVEGYASLPLRDFAPLRRHDVAPWFFDTVEEPPAERRDAAAAVHHEGVTVPSLNIGGWYDIFAADTIANYATMRARGVEARLLVGPWTHVGRTNPIGQRNFGFGAQGAFVNLEMDLGALQLRWFDHALRGLENGVADEPPVRIFVMGVNRWRSLPDWPPPADATRLFLRAGGELSREAPGDEAPDAYDYDPADPVPTRGGALLMTPEFPSGPLNQRDVERRPDVLTYTTAPLAADLEVTGPVHVELWAVSSAPDTDFVARLVDVLPDGTAFNLCDGIVRARYRDCSGARPAQLIEPGRAYLYSIDLWATSNVFLAGHRIRLQVTSSCFPRWDRNPNTGHELGADAELRVAHQRILHDAAHASHVVLPVVRPA